jgi:chromosome segregation ATPase
MGNRADEDAYSQNGRGSNGQSFSQPLRSPSRLGSAHGQESELAKLRAQLADRDRRLEEQANNLAEMESSVKELSALIPTDGSSPGGGRSSDYDDKNSAQLRQALREKNEKISILTADFDAHRADFRSTLDSLEMASSETERVYEEQKRDLLAQLNSLNSWKSSSPNWKRVLKKAGEAKLRPVVRLSSCVVKSSEAGQSCEEKERRLLQRSRMQEETLHLPRSSKQRTMKSEA